MVGTKVIVKRMVIPAEDHIQDDFGVIVKVLKNMFIDNGGNNPKFYEEAYIVKWKGHQLCVIPEEMELVN